MSKQTANKQLEAPPLPAAPMTATPKQRADLAYVKQALREGQAKENPDDELEELEPGEKEPETPPPAAHAAPGASPEGTQGFGAPEWFQVPPGGLPADIEPGSAVGFMRFPVWVTGVPQKGERQCALRPLTPALEKFGYASVKGSNNGFITLAALARMMICVVDGRLPELFKAGPGSVNHFWAEIGPKGRQAITTYYSQTHQFTEKERDSFLAGCLEVRTVG